MGTVTISSPDGSVLDQRSYQWDQDSNKTRRVDVRTGLPQDAFTHAYDALSRLTTVTPDSGSATAFTYDGAGNRTNSGYSLEGPDALVNQYTATPWDKRAYDALGHLSSYNARAKWYTFDALGRVTTLTEAGTRTVDDFTSLPGNYTVAAGTWVASNGILSETSANTGRILRALPSGTTSFAFSYKSPNDAANLTDYDPERYGLAVLRLFTSDWKYAALVLEPTGLYLREWNNNALVGELASASVAARADTWYDVKVAYSGADNRTVAVSWAERGTPFRDLFTATLSANLAEGTGQQLGFGVGQLGDYEFRDVQFRDTSSTADTVVVSYQYDALGRRISKTINPGGTTYYYYDGDRLIEERNAGGTLQASYVYGVYVDEPLQMTRNSQTYYYAEDDQHNVVALTDGSGAVVERYAYGPFGAPATGSSLGNPFLFTGREWDPELACYWYRSRHYDPAAGRFLSRDRLGLWGDPMNLGNPYSYVGNNPWSYADPFGLEAYPEGFWGWTGYYASESVAGSGQGIKGFFWTGPKNAAVGLYTMVRHPIQTGQGLYGFGEAVCTDFPGVAGQAWESAKQIPRDPERIGSIGFDLASGVATGGAAKLAQLHRLEKLAKLADKASAHVAQAEKLVRRIPSDVPPKTPNILTGEGYGVSDPPVRVEGVWTEADFRAALQGKAPPGLGRPDLHHADQMPGSGIHEVLPKPHRGSTALHPNRFDQGVTTQMRTRNRQLHWWYRAREQGADQLYPDWIYDE